MSVHPTTDISIIYVSEKRLLLHITWRYGKHKYLRNTVLCYISCWNSKGTSQKIHKSKFCICGKESIFKFLLEVQMNSDAITWFIVAKEDYWMEKILFKTNVNRVNVNSTQPWNEIFIFLSSSYVQQVKYIFHKFFSLWNFLSTKMSTLKKKRLNLAAGTV